MVLGQLGATLIGALSVALPVFIVLVGAVAVLSGRLSRIEARLEAVITVRECGDIRSRCPAVRDMITGVHDTL